MQKHITKITKTTDEFFVYWVLTDLCNFNCFYCNIHSGEHSAAGTLLTKEGVDTVVTFLKSKKEQHGRVSVILTGGEPTLFPLFDYVLNSLNEIGVRTVVITNGTRPLHWWEGLLSLPKKIIISIHSELTKIDKVNELGRFCIANDISLQVSSVYNPRDLSKSIYLESQLVPELKNIVLQKAVANLTELHSDGSFGEVYQYPPEIEKLLKDSSVADKEDATGIIEYSDGTRESINPHSLVTQFQNRFLGWKCSAGINNIEILPNGDVYNGLCSSKKLGTITDFKLNDAPTFCMKKVCWCPSDIMLDKRRSAISVSIAGSKKS